MSFGRTAVFLAVCAIGVSACVASPYLYVSFHGGGATTGVFSANAATDVNNVYRYNLDGADVVTGVLGPPRNSNIAYDQLRCMSIDSYGNLIISNAYKEASMIYRFDPCDSSGQRGFKDVLVNGNVNKDLAHSYGVNIDNKSGFMFTASQDTFKVLRFNATTGAPAGIGDDQNELFIDFGSDDLRGVVTGYVSGSFILMVADKITGPQFFNMKAEKIGAMNITSPIYTYFEESTETFFVGSSDTNLVYQYDFKNQVVLRTFGGDGTLSHPAGITSYQGTLYVISQDDQKLQSYNILTGAFLQTVVDGFPDTPEGLHLSPC